MVVREKRASRMSGEGLGSGRVRKNKMVLRVLNSERVTPVSMRYIAPWRRTHLVGYMTLV